MIKYICDHSNEYNNYENNYRCNRCMHNTLHLSPNPCLECFCNGEKVKCIFVNDSSKKEIKEKIENIIESLRYCGEFSYGKHDCAKEIMAYLEKIGLIVKEENK